MSFCVNCLNSGTFGCGDERQHRADKVPGVVHLRFCVCKKGRRMKQQAKRAEHTRLKEAVVATTLDYVAIEGARATREGQALLRACDALNAFERGTG